METALQTAEIRIITPLLDVINPTLSRILGTDLKNLTETINMAIELGIGSDGKARDAESLVQNGRKAIKAVNEIRLMFTRPIDEGKKMLMDEVKSLLYPLTESNAKLDRMVMSMFIATLVRILRRTPQKHQ